MPIRKSCLFLGFVAGCGLAGLAIAGRQVVGRPELAESARRSVAVVKELGLTDLSLFTEARYTRNPSQADWHAPFQDHPLALEHFPVGALAAPPSPR